jgi:hypothetical protein
MLSFQASAASRRVGGSVAVAGEFGDVGGCEERGDFHGQREGRIAAIFFPAILLRNRAVAQIKLAALRTMGHQRSSLPNCADSRRRRSSSRMGKAVSSIWTPAQ